jgi:hypothetical protein
MSFNSSIKEKSTNSKSTSKNSKKKSDLLSSLTTDLTIYDFPHTAPEGYSYQFELFNTRLVSIWLLCHRCFDYNMGKPTRTIWGFYSPKKGEYYAPINSSKCGDKVDIQNTRSYTAMPIKRTALEAAFYD